jgi:hypothetical protein
VNVEDQLREAITRQADRYEVPPPDIEGFAAGAMRRRRRDRMVAALAACAVVAVVASGFVAERIWWDTRGAGPVDQPTSPIWPTQESTTSSSADDRVGLIGPPPPGTPPAGPATGELVAAAQLYFSGTFVYADGRIISVVRNTGDPDFRGYRDEFRGFVVRQLTPSGVEAMRSFLLDGTSGLTPVEKTDGSLLMVRDAGRLMSARGFNGCRAWFDRCPSFTEPEQWLPASAWDDPTFRPFVPHSYRVELWSEDPRSSPAEILPAEAVDLLLGPESPLADSPVGQEGLSARITTPVARQLADAMDQAGPAYPRQEGNNVGYALPSGGYLALQTVLPHGGTFCDCG